MGRKSQVDKFYQKWYKHREDTRAIIEGQMRKEKEAKWYGDVEGVEELMEKGNIKEAAVVFSHEGMKLFTELFSNSIENKVEEALNKGIIDLQNKMEELIEKSVEKKLVEMLEGITEGIKQFANKNLNIQLPVQKPDIPADPLTGEDTKADLTHLTLENYSKDDMETLEQLAPSVEPIIVEGPVAKITVEKSAEKADKLSTEEGIRLLGLKDAKEVLPLVVEILKSNNGPMRLSEISQKLQELHNMKLTPSGCTSFMQKLIKLDYNIEKAGYGLYEYREKNFKPTL